MGGPFKNRVADHQVLGVGTCRIRGPDLSVERVELSISERFRTLVEGAVHDHDFSFSLWFMWLMQDILVVSTSLNISRFKSVAVIFSLVLWTMYIQRLNSITRTYG